VVTAVLSRKARSITEEVAKREGCSVRKVNTTISLAFLAPDLVKAAIEGRLPYGLGVTGASAFERVAVDAVHVEPVSWAAFPGNREINSEVAAAETPAGEKMA